MCVHESHWETGDRHTISLLTSISGSFCWGVSAVAWVMGADRSAGAQGGRLVQIKQETGGWEVGSQTTGGCDNTIMLKATSRPLGRSRFHHPASTCRFLLSPLPASPSENSRGRVAELRVKGHRWNPEMLSDVTVTCLLGLDLHCQIFSSGVV